MAQICPDCKTVHYRGAIDCLHNRKLIQHSAEQMRHDVHHHLEMCAGCPDPEQHLRNLARLQHPDKPFTMTTRFRREEMGWDQRLQFWLTDKQRYWVVYISFVVTWAVGVLFAFLGPKNLGIYNLVIAFSLLLLGIIVGFLVSWFFKRHRLEKPVRIF